MNPHRKIRVSTGMSPALSRPVQGGLTAAALVFAPLLAVVGSDALRAALDFTTGVLSLVSLSAAVVWGLLATDRAFLSARGRIVCQGVHRATAVAALGFLLLHGTVKVALGHVAPAGALVPFGLGVTGTAGLIGFGSLAGLLMIVTAATGALRSAFAQPSPTAARLGQSLGSARDTGGIAGRWRSLHALAYPAWCAALIHGLYAGRAPATWVVVMYGLCLTGVAAALCLRLLPYPVKRRIADRVSELLGQGPPAAPDPVLRDTGQPVVPSSSGTGSASGAPAVPEPWSAPSAWPDPPAGARSEHALGFAGTPMRPRTLAAPAPPSPEAETETTAKTLYGVGPSLHEPPHRPLHKPPYEPPPRSADRLAFGLPDDLSNPGLPHPDLPDQGLTGRGHGTPGPGPAPGPGLAAGYRAVSFGGGPSPRPGTRWPAPSPAPPAQARHGSPRREPAAHTSPEHTCTPPPSPFASPTPPHVPAHSPFASPTPRAVPDPGAGPCTAPPAGEPWHTPAGDRP
ncbi:hypothetical protein ACIODW_15050 [Streptomyces sp. NPDC087897]|uniref:hypothetical protein n=1 Tax=Streptomyces sp. NPDC087897 TaxID=3365817 RepID=UPI0038080425